MEVNILFTFVLPTTDIFLICYQL